MFRQFFSGRYGQDQLSRAMIIFAVILYVVSLFFRVSPAGTVLWIAAMAVLLLTILRMMSRNAGARQRENEKYLNLRDRLLGRFRRGGGYNSYNGYGGRGGYNSYNGYGGGYNGHNGGAYRSGADAGRTRRNPTFSELRQYKYFNCNQCGQRMRVPRGKGRLRVTCTRCANRFETRS